MAQPWKPTERWEPTERWKPIGQYRTGSLPVKPLQQLIINKKLPQYLINYIKENGKLDGVFNMFTRF
jgi:hypothetical protein